MTLNHPRSLGFGNSHVSARIDLSVSDLPDDSSPGNLFDSQDDSDEEDNPDDSET